MRARPHPLLTAYGLLLVLCLAAYWPGLDGGFAFDDYHVIVSNDTLAIADLSPEPLLDAAFSTATGPLRRPLSMLSFAADRSLFGLDPSAFKFTSLLIHALNAGLLLMLLCRVLPRLTGSNDGSTALAVLITATWAVHPINLTSVLYVVQRMTLLASTFMLAGILVYCWLRQAQLAGRPRARGWWLLLPACLMMGLACKESAVLLPVFIAVVEYTVFSSRRSVAGRRRAWLAPALLGVGGVLLLIWAWPYIAAEYRGREFSLTERLLTQARVLLAYLHMLIWPAPDQFAMFHDDVAISRGLLTPPSTLPALLLVGVAALLALRGRPRVLAFACGWFLAGHALESSFLPLELMHEHRNYLAGIGVVGGVLIGFDVLARRWLPAGLRFAPAAAALIGVALLTGLRAGAWSDPYTQMALEVKHHSNSARSLYEFGRLSFERGERTADPALRQVGRDAIERAALLKPNPRPYLAYGAALKLALNAGDAARAQHWLDAVASHRSARIRVEVLLQLINCQAYADCVTAPAPVIELAGRILADTSLKPYWRRRAVEWLAIYYLRVLDDPDGGIAMLRDLVAERPADDQRLLRLAEALAATGALDEARMLASDIAARQGWQVRYLERPWWRRVMRLLDKLDTPADAT